MQFFSCCSVIQFWNCLTLWAKYLNVLNSMTLYCTNQCFYINFSLWCVWHFLAAHQFASMGHGLAILIQSQYSHHGLQTPQAEKTAKNHKYSVCYLPSIEMYTVSNKLVNMMGHLPTIVKYYTQRYSHRKTKKRMNITYINRFDINECYCCSGSARLGNRQLGANMSYINNIMSNYISSVTQTQLTKK